MTLQSGGTSEASGAAALTGGALPPAQAALATRTISQIRVHGNHSTPDAMVLELAGVKPGDPATDATPKQIEDRLQRSRRFDRVEVLARSRSLDGSDLSLVILIE